MKRKFIIIDPGLSRLGGHNYTLAMTFSDAAHAMGYEVLWFCHKIFPAQLVPNHVRAEQVFSLSYYKKFRLRWHWVNLYNWTSDRLGGIPPLAASATGTDQTPSGRWTTRLWRGIFPFAGEMAAALKRHGVAPTDHGFVTTAEYLQYAALLHLFVTEPRDRLPFLHVRTSFDESAEVNSRFGFRLPGLFRQFLELGVVEKRIFFYAETPALAAHFKGCGLVPFESLENPAPRHLLATPFVSRNRGTDRLLTIVFPGQARIEKGYLRLPGIVSALQARGGLARPYRFVVQSNLRKLGKKERARRKDRDRLAAKEALGCFPEGTVRLLNKPLSNEEYYALIAEADVVLLPYDAERYRNRPSMIASEAALFGKPMVVTAGTTLAAFAEPGSGELAVTDQDFAEGLAKIINDHDAYKAKAEARAATLRRGLDGRTLIGRMVDRAEGTGEGTQGCSGTAASD